MRALSLLILAAFPFFVLADDSDIDAGKVVYEQTCIACHGANGKGAIPGVANLTRADGALTKSDAALLKSIVEGVQTSGSPLAMPAYGGNPSLTQADVKAVIAYLRATFGQ